MIEGILTTKIPEVAANYIPLDFVTELPSAETYFVANDVVKVFGRFVLKELPKSELIAVFLKAHVFLNYSLILAAVRRRLTV